MTVRVAFLSPCGGGNLGDAAIVDSLIAGIRRRVPDAAIVGFTQNPEDTEQRHRVPTTRFRPNYRASIVAGAGDANGDEPGPSSPQAARGWPTVRAAIGNRLPGARALWRSALGLLADYRYFRQVEHMLRGFDVVAVAGGGQIDELFGGPLTHLHGLWRYGAMARRSGARFVILSVGTGTLTSRVGRVLARRCLALADYASFRDDRSRELVGDSAIGVPIVPDLAYGLPVSWSAGTERSGPPVVGVSPMAYADPRFWPRQDVARYRRHVASFAHLTTRLVRAGNRVVLFTSDGPDEAPRDELRAEVSAQLGPEESGMVTVAGTRTVAELMEVLSRLDVVVSARLHGVLLAHVAGRPVLAIAHERKVATLMGEMNQSQYCYDIDDFDPEVGWARLQELVDGREHVARDVRVHVEAYRRRVEGQYDLVFGEPKDA